VGPARPRWTARALECPGSGADLLPGNQACHGAASTLQEADGGAKVEDVCRRLKQMVADQALDIQALKAVARRRW